MKKNLKSKTKGSSFLKMKDSDKANLIVLSIFVACFVLGYLVLIPRVNLYRDSEISIEDSKALKKNLDTKASLLSDLADKIKANAVFIKKTQDVLPSEPQVPELLLMINNLAINNSLYINTFSPIVEEDKKAVATNKAAEKVPTVAWKTVNLRFDIIGKYPDIKNFIEALEQNIRPLDIKSISISEGGDLKSVDKILRFHIDANAYYQ